MLTSASEGQVQPFWLDTMDGENLFCWHVLPLDVYLEHESELVQAVTTGEVVDELERTVGAKLLRSDGESRVVVNFHGVSTFSCLLLCFGLFFFFLSLWKMLGRYFSLSFHVILFPISSQYPSFLSM
jgi:hypothetical protein